MFSSEKIFDRTISMLFLKQNWFRTKYYVIYPHYVIDFFGHYFWTLRPKISQWTKFWSKSQINGVSLIIKFQSRSRWTKFEKIFCIIKFGSICTSLKNFRLNRAHFDRLWRHGKILRFSINFRNSEDYNPYANYENDKIIIFWLIKRLNI